GVRRTGGARAVAGLGRVAGARRRAADEGPARAREPVGRAHGPAAGAVLGDVARPRRRPADDARRLEVVGRAGGRRARAALRHVAGAGRGPAHDRRGLEGVGRARCTRPVARLVHVAGAGRRPAHGAAVPRQVLAGVVRPVAGVGRAEIAVVRARRARGHLPVGRACRPRPGAGLRRVALAGRGAADGEARQEGVRRAGGARAVAGLVHVARAGRRAAYRAGVPGRVLAGAVRPVAGVGRARAAVVGARGARGRLVVRGTAGSAARAVLRRVALARRGAADDGRGLEGVGRAGRARPVARLVLVARAGGR